MQSREEEGGFQPSRVTGARFWVGGPAGLPVEGGGASPLREGYAPLLPRCFT